MSAGAPLLSMTWHFVCERRNLCLIQFFRRRILRLCVQCPIH
jgi:hypothetical protein